MKRTAIAIAVGALSAGLSHGLLAQDSQDEESPQNQSEEQQQSEDSAQDQGSQSEVRVEEEAADVDVEQEPADIEVEQEPPDVTVEQEPPEVTIEQEDPNVDVEQAEPDVSVEKEGEADVEVEHADEAEAELIESDEKKDEERSDQSAEEQSSDNEALMSQTVSEIEGQTLYSQEDDEEIGEVEVVVRDTETNDIFIVIAEGGFLGFGEDEMGYSLDEVEVRAEEELAVQSSDRGESGDYGSDRYEEVDDDMTLREASQGN